ncbi:putative aminopeptidase N [Apostichopus japonicus]|uniref:Aminopeptidase n=1 Tax=Stichopus japonicus TaxID=307972 RepID=A0A2G8L626_STIJA|nr:putative aminopeptidase N [Apostichopus japonicus]
MADNKFEVEDTESNDSIEKKKDGVYCSTGKLFFCGLVACCLIAGVGLISYYVPDRTCTFDELPTENPLEGSPTMKPSDMITEPQRSSTPHHMSSTENPSPTPTEAFVWDGRLNPDIMTPRSYDLTLQPCLYYECGEAMRFRFYGWVDIVIEVDEDTDQVVMHMVDIEIKSISVKKLVGDDTELYMDWSNDTLYEFLIIHTQTLMKRTDYRVSIEYIGILQDGLAGFYRSSYKNANGETVWLATSQMQATDARRALPCWDEPGFRSTFETSIIHMENMTALSNGIELGTVDYEEGWKITAFKTTPKMPTYLLAFVVSDFDYVEKNTTNGVRFRVWSRKDAIGSANYGLEQGVEILTYFEDYFGVPFPMDKQDMVAVPDFSAGAMENWGLILYRETALLYDPAENSAANKQRVAVVVSHELAHQWFGNLVTPEWWDDLWLNEGFASFVEYLGVDFTEPTWKMMEQFLAEDLHRVFALDALGSSHPVRVPVNSPAEISEIFDTISYAKGASIIRMLNNILSEETFRRGLNRYLTHYSEGNANSDKLWDALNQVQDQYDVKKIMDTWTLQMGYPVITVTRSGSTLNVQQSHFLIDPESEVDDKYIDLGLFSKITRAMLFTKGILVIKRNATRKPRGLIDDAFNLARGGQLTYDIALDMTKYLKNELDFIPWEATLTVFAYIRDMFSRNAGFGDLEKYMLCQINTLYTAVGFEDDPNDAHLDQYNRINAVDTACYYGNEDCLANATREYNEYMSDDINEKYLNYMLDETVVRKQDASYVIRYVARNYVGRALAWDFLRSEWDTIFDFYGDSSFSFSNIITDVTEQFNTEFDLEELMKFGEGRNFGSAVRAYEQAIDQTKSNIAWMERNAVTVAETLAASVADLGC